MGGLTPGQFGRARLSPETTTDPAGHAPHRLHRQPAHIQQFPHEIGFPDLPGFAIFPPYSGNFRVMEMFCCSPHVL